jgi:hypothetical protein
VGKPTRQPTESDYDTDDLIEDARNFVLAAGSKLVGEADWGAIDEKRRQRRRARGERAVAGGSGSLPSMPCPACCPPSIA